jgi:glycerol-3-phosphate O-acyltransferase
MAELAPDETPGDGQDGNVPPEYRPNFVLAWLYRRLFSRIEVEPNWVESVREASRTSTVVHVMRSRSYLDFFALDFFLKRASLPVLGFVMNLGLWLLEPIFRGGFFRGLFRSSRPPPEGETLLAALDQRRSALLFLRKPSTFVDPKHRGENVSVDLVRVLIERQRQTDEPIVLIPQVLVWGRTPDMLEHGVVDQVFGSRDYPGRLRVIAQFFWYFRKAILRACEPLNLKELLAESSATDPDALVNRVHWILVTRLDRERRVILGPRFKSPDRIRDELLRTPRVREAIADAARREKKSVEQATRAARRELDRLAARPAPWLYPYAEWLMDRIFHRLYDGIEVDLAALRRVREQARVGPVVLLPSHKSHLDYLLLSYVCWKAGMAIPLIAAGDNLSFWPAGPVLRRVGAFFIRRSFAGARLYTTLVEGYIRRLLGQGYPIEFFLEGGRSRTGKLLAPKVGLLTMVAEAAQAAGVAVAYVPIAIGYERIVEQRSYEDELAGGEKQSENAAQLVESLPQILTARYGRAYIRFGQILRFELDDSKTALANAPNPPTNADSEKRTEVRLAHARRDQVQVFASRIMREIGAAIPITPAALVATALLQQTTGSTARPALLKQIDRLCEALDGNRANFVGALRRRELREAAVDQVIALFVEHRLLQIGGTERAVTYQVVPKRRVAVDYYKNNIIHLFVPRALAAIALLSLRNNEPEFSVSRATLCDRYAQLCALFDREFSLDDDRVASLDSAVEELSRAQALTIRIEQPEREGGEPNDVHITASPEQLVQLREYAEMLQNTCEAWWLAARALRLIESGSMPAKELLRKTLALGQRLLIAGDLSRPEAVSKPLIESAFASLRDRGVLTGGESGPQRRTDAYSDNASVVVLAEELRRWCLHRGPKTKASRPASGASSTGSAH